MWIPFTRTEPEALYSAAAAVSYGCVASIHPWGLWERRSNSIRPAAAEIYKSSYAMGRRVSPHLASARPFRFALIHISEHSRNLRIADPRALWVELFAPILGAFETLKEEHLPVCTINDNQLEQGIPPETRLVILPRESDCTGAQRTVLRRFQSAGGVVLGLENDRGWHLEAEKPKRKQELAAKINAAVATPPMRARGPVAMHAVFFQNPPSRKTVVCFVNRFGWFRSQRDVSDADRQWTAPPPCRQVELEIADPQRSIVRAFEALTGKDLTVDYQNARATVRLPEFPVMACAVLERRPSD
jgi:hypothetical protein